MTDIFDAPIDSGTPTDTPVIDKPGVDTEQFDKISKRLNDSQTFIETLKAERAEDRATIAELTEKLNLFITAREVMRDDSEDVGKQPVQPVVDPAALKKAGFLTADDLLAAEKKKAEAANLEAVLTAGRAQYGEKLNEHIENRCTEVGVNIAWARTLASNNPKAFNELFGIKAVTKATGAPTETSLNIRGDSKVDDTPKSVMFGATTNDMMNAWKRAAAKLK